MPKGIKGFQKGNSGFSINRNYLSRGIVSPLKGRKRPPRSKEWCDKISKANTSKQHTEEQKIKMSIKMKELGYTPPIFKSLDKNPNWRGGISSKTRVKYAPRPKPEQCEVCGAMGTICLDHDHNTNEFRGWICNRCNVALGMVKDNSETLIALAEYIRKSRGETLNG